MRFQVVSAAYVFPRRTVDGVEQVLLQLREGTGCMDGHWAAAAAGHVEAAESVLDEPRTVEADKSVALRWFDLDALPEPVVPHERHVLHALVRGAVPPVLVHGFRGAPGR